MPAKIDRLAEARQIAKDRNWICLATEHSHRIPMPWHCNICTCDWKACLYSVKGSPNQKGTGCPNCAIEARKMDGLAEARQIGIDRKGKCHATIYINASTPMPWSCDICGCNWKACLGTVKDKPNSKGTWCPECADAEHRLDGLAEAQQIAKANNWECRATAYINSSTPMPWHCNICTCDWEACLSNVKGSPSKKATKCPDCIYESSKLDWFTESQRIAKANNWECRATTYINGRTPIPWHCNICQCDWEASLGSVKGTKNRKGTGCPRCKNKHQKEMTKMISKFTFGHTVQTEYNDLVWQKTVDYHRMSFDNYIYDLLAVIEDDGRQHFEPVQFGGISMERAEHDFEDNRRRDANKNQRVSEHQQDVRIFIRIPYTVPLTEENIQHELLMNGIGIWAF